MKKIIFILTLILVTSCINKVETETDCSSDSDCTIGGCSGQLCSSKSELQNIVTTCEWREVYSCYKLTSCSCINSKCQWKQTESFEDCIKRF